MVSLLLFSSANPAKALPALELLGHSVRTVPPSVASLASSPAADVHLVDGTVDLLDARKLCGILCAADASVPILLALTEGGLPAVAPDWGVADVILQSAGPAEVDARLRLLRRRVEEERSGTLQVGFLAIDEDSYTATYRGRILDLTFKEFELLRHLAAHPDHVFTRERLLSEVWGYDYYGGTRTVDVHVRRLRAKLGDNESVIGTVRNVGYRLVRPGVDGERALPSAGDPSATTDRSTTAGSTDAVDDAVPSARSARGAA